MFIRKLTCIFAIAGLLIVPGCKKSYYSVTPHKKLPALSSDNALFEEVNNHVTIRVKKYAQENITTLFGDYGEKLLETPAIYPIQIAIDNQSNATWLISPRAITLPCTPQREILKRINHDNVYKNSLYLLFGGIVTAELMLTASLIMLSHGNPLAIPLAWLSFSLGVATPFYTHKKTAQQTEHNCALTYDIARYTLNKKTTIRPGQHLNKLIFIPEEQSSSDFTITLINQDNKKEKCIFNINL